MRLLLCILFSVSIIKITAQVDSDAIQLLDNVSEKMKKSEAWKVEFDYTIENKRENTLHNQSGLLKFKGDKYILDILGNIVFFDEKKNYNYIKEVNEVNIMNAEDNEEFFFIKPTELFSFYKEGFKARYNETLKIHNIEMYSVDLFPNDLNKSYFKINILITLSDKSIKSIKVFNKDGITYEVYINSLEAIQIDDSAFTFNQDDYPDVEIIDMTE